MKDEDDIPFEEWPRRWQMGEGWIRCSECGARLCSFDLPSGQGYDKFEKCWTPQDC